jgi:hypothetical protein
MDAILTAMKTAVEVLFDPTIYGHAFLKPLLWQERQVSWIFMTPLPIESSSRALEVIARAVSFVALAVFSIVTLPATLVGWAIKYYFQLSEPIDSPDGPGGGSPPPPATQLEPAAPRPELTREIVATATSKLKELKALYEGLMVLSGCDAQKLFKGMGEFLSSYEQYRDPDPSAVDGMTKNFNTFDEIAVNTSGMQRVMEFYSDFYRVQADVNDVIQQPADGNCWLHTSIVGLQLINHQGIDNETHETLRPQVVQWMRDRCTSDLDLNGHIKDAIEAHEHVGMIHSQEAIMSFENPIYTDAERTVGLANQQREQEILRGFTFDQYFDQMENVGSHGSRAEFYAISRMFEVNVVIWRDVRGQLTNEWDLAITNPRAEHTINVVHVEGNHFNYRLPGGP